MRPDRTYLDWNATAPLHPAAREAMLAALDLRGNPSSPHGDGRAARALIERARERLSDVFGVASRNVYFTSGATEAANWVLHPQAGPGSKPLQALLIGATEHACIQAGHRFPAHAVSQLPVLPDGRIDLAALEARLSALTAQHGTGCAMVALQAANNETGVLQPIDEVRALLEPHGAVLVCDAVQALGRAPIPRADFLFVSAHKIGGPTGVGAVIFASEALSPPPLIAGGGQERRQRSGTENVAGISGFAAAVEAVIQSQPLSVAHAAKLRDKIERGLQEIHGETVVLASSVSRLVNTTCFAVPGMSSETALIALDLAGIAVSSGAACSSGKVASSHVLAAMQVPEALARGALRVSTGPTTQEADVETFLSAWREIIARRFQHAA